MKAKAVSGWEQFEGHSPHRPWIDLVAIRCTSCGGTANRITDVGTPWLDAGIVPYSTMKYDTDREYWESWFPADFITECFPGQFRNWFYALLSMSAMMTGRAPFKVLLGHALVRDEHGNEMHKSLGNAINFDEAAEKMSADLMRWMFCRQNPQANINFGYGPADAVRNKFVLKLWNTYAFFCNYARLDQFDPEAAQIPIEQRPDIDRWLLSDLQLLIIAARREYERFNIMSFCMEAEDFVDSRLSNWYIRRNRRRFWKSEQGADKQAAYQTLYTVLTTLAKLLAPAMPFLTESMHQNLAADNARMPSIHLCDFPVADESLIDEDLSAEMNALLRIVSLGSAARNSVKLKVRQPLARMVVRPGSKHEFNAVNRFATQICDELNIKTVTIAEPAAALLDFDPQLDRRTLGAKLGPAFGEAERALQAMQPAAVWEKLQSNQAVELSLAGGTVAIEPSEITARWKAADGCAGIADGATQVLIDIRITEELAREGMAREAVRHIQELRKKSGLEPEDRIELFLRADSATLAAALQAHREYISNETLSVRWVLEPLNGAKAAEVKIDGQVLRIELLKTHSPH